jgi:probable DNA repair protein
VETVADRRAPAVASVKIRGGTRVLADQAACPFRAFARWRLGAEPLEEPTAGLDARERGTLLHTLMKEIWSRLKNQASLSGNVGPAIAQSADIAVKEAGLEGRFAEVERARLARVAREWLEIEKQRAPFEVTHLEEKKTISIAGLKFQGRLDRMDRLADGGQVLIDYKTGRATPNSWDGARPDEPQLPLYSLNEKQITGVAFARVKTGAMRFMGFSEKKGVIPKVDEAENLPNLLKTWKQHAEEMAEEFKSGEARVEPKYDLKTCRSCDLQTLCRVYEKTSFLGEEEEQ